ncbi:hypothetical protein RN001_015252 [Aquatica leii]|uniref:Proteasome assembly chaperone 2 n=1 Tax=Aquatica leii TaxID=1421715 RepID=A0AAN7SL22_9COLE|nr:hypothetical protein RN001_015252 [Aquatica leii]
MKNIINIVNEIDTTDFTFLIPSVAVGNVGQLTIDLLISTYQFTKYATIWHPAILPSISGDPFDNNSTNISTACELFINNNLKLIVMQLRSGIENKLAVPFFNTLKDNITNLGCKQILILTSAFAHELHNINLSHFRYISNDQSIIDKLNSIDALPIEEVSIFGGGFATKLHSILQDSFKCSLIMKYSSEGDNVPDAVQFLEVITQVLQNFNEANKRQFAYPSSWKYTFGNPPPINIY